MKFIYLKLLLFLAFLALTLRPATAQTELIQNGGFEASTSSIAPWQINNSANAPQNVESSVGAYAGSECLLLAGYASSGTSYSQDIYQTVTFPTNLIQATLSFEINIPSTDPNVLSSDTILNIEIADQNGNVLADTQASNLTPTTNYYLYTSTFVTNAASGYAGETVNVHFISSADSVLAAYTPFYIDNVSLQVATTANIPINDNFSNATVISGPTATILANNSFASKEPGEPNFANFVGGHSLWWTWTAPSNGIVTVTTSSSIQTLVGVYTGTQVGNLAQVAASPTQVSFKANAGTQYAIGVDGYVGATGAFTLGFSFLLDTTLPIVTILAPLPNASLTNPFVTVTGTASDNLAVAQVQYRLENSAGTNNYQTATGTNHWSATVYGLIPGPNTVRVRSVDTSGNNSVTVTRTYNYIIVSPLTLTINGRGTVSGATNGQLLAIGNTYHLTALPAVGFGFGGWSGGTNSNSTSLAFVMQTNLYLQANFVDITKPVLTITNPAISGAHASNSLFIVSGKALDNVAVTNVYLSLNHGGWIQASSTNAFTNWFSEVVLTPGTNTLSAYAVDSSGNFSITNMVAFTYLLSAPLVVNTNGRGVVVPNYNHVALPLGAAYALTATAAAGFAFTNWTDGGGHVLTNRPVLKFVMASNLVFTANFADVTRPTLAVTNVAAGGGVSNQFFTVRGLAADNVGVVGVVYNLNDAGWQGLSPGGDVTNWAADLTLVPGTNTLAAYAVDAAGNVSVTNTVKFVYVLSAPLVVATNGPGRIAPAYNHVLLQLGKRYTLTATPGLGNVFTNWTDGGGNVLTNQPTLAFTMASNLMFTANFLDVTRPTVTVTTPTPLTSATNEFYPASGKAADNVAVAAVWYQLNRSGTWYLAAGTTNWSQTLELAPGTNTLAVYALDSSGHPSLTNTTQFLYVTAPATLSGRIATITANNVHFTFGATAFSLDSTYTSHGNGVGSYTYTRQSATGGLLKYLYTGPPTLGDVGLQTLSLTFSNPATAFYNVGGSPGSITFTSTPTLVVPSLLNQTLVQVDSTGGALSTFFSAATYASRNLATGATNRGTTYTYGAYGPLGGLAKLNSTNGTRFLVPVFQGTNYGQLYAETYDGSNNLSGEDLGQFALASQHAGGNAPTNLVNRSLVVTTNGAGYQLNFWDGVNFASVSLADQTITNDTGTYGYSRTGTNTATLLLNYAANPAAALNLRFYAPNFALCTNTPDNSFGAAVLK